MKNLILTVAAVVVGSSLLFANHYMTERMLADCGFEELPQNTQYISYNSFTGRCAVSDKWYAVIGLADYTVVNEGN